MEFTHCRYTPVVTEVRPRCLPHRTACRPCTLQLPAPCCSCYFGAAAATRPRPANAWGSTVICATVQRGFAPVPRLCRCCFQARTAAAPPLPRPAPGRARLWGGRLHAAPAAHGPEDQAVHLRHAVQRGLRRAAQDARGHLRRERGRPAAGAGCAGVAWMGWNSPGASGGGRHGLVLAAVATSLACCPRPLPPRHDFLGG